MGRTKYSEETGVYPGFYRGIARNYNFLLNRYSGSTAVLQLQYIDLSGDNVFIAVEKCVRHFDGQSDRTSIASRSLLTVGFYTLPNNTILACKINEPD